jgi:hypothetical protein
MIQMKKNVSRSSEAERRTNDLVPVNLRGRARVLAKPFRILRILRETLSLSAE